MESVDQFMEQLMDAKGITVADPEIKKEVIANMRDRLLEQIDKAALLELSEEQLDVLEEKMEDPSFTKEQLAQYIADCGVDWQQVTFDTMMRFRNLYLNAGA